MQCWTLKIPRSTLAHSAICSAFRHTKYTITALLACDAVACTDGPPSISAIVKSTTRAHYQSDSVSNRTGLLGLPVDMLHFYLCCQLYLQLLLSPRFWHFAGRQLRLCCQLGWYCDGLSLRPLSSCLCGFRCCGSHALPGFSGITQGMPNLLNHPQLHPNDPPPATSLAVWQRLSCAQNR